MGGSSLGPEVLAETFGRSPAGRASTCSTAPIRPRSRRSKGRSISARRCSSSPASPAARSSPISCTDYFFERVERRAWRGQGGRRTSSPSPTRARSWNSAPRSGTLPHVFLGDAVDRRTLFGAVRTSAWCRPRPWASTSGVCSRAPRRWCARCGPDVPPARQSGRAARRRAGRRGDALWPRQGDDHRLAGIADLRRLAGAAPGRITGKQGKGLIPVDGEPLGAPDAMATTGFSSIWTWRGTTTSAGRAVEALEKRRPSGRADRRERHLASRPGVLPLGDRHRRRRRGHRHQSLRPARRRGEQDQDARADRRYETVAASCRRGAVFARTGSRSMPIRATPPSLAGTTRWPAI